MSTEYENMTREQLLLLARQLKGEVENLRGGTAGPPQITPFGKRGKTVVIVDDSKLIHARFKSIIEPLGFEVVGTAEDGALGLQKVLKLQPALVLLDYQMPVMNGEQTAREIRKHDTEIKILVVSGTLVRPVAKALLNAGVSDILVKPIDVHKFKESLKHIGFSLDD